MAKARINIEDRENGVDIQWVFEGEPGSQLKVTDFNPESPAHQVTQALLTKGAEAIGLVAAGPLEVARVVNSAEEHMSPGGLVLPAGVDARPLADVIPFPVPSPQELIETVTQPVTVVAESSETVTPDISA